MSDDVDALIDLATAIADGNPVQWPLDQPGSLDADRVVLANLRVIADLVALHHRVATEPLTDSVADELRQALPPDARETLPAWGPLRLIGVVGHGAFGEVYRAWDPNLDRVVALKLLRRQESGHPSASAVVNEGRLLAKVRHPHVVTVYGADRIGGHVGVWMEFVDGKTLTQLVASNGPLPSTEVVAIGRDLCAALAAVHRAGLLHRDIKAQNVMRDSDGRIVLMDFGTGREAHAVGAGEMAGTPLYLAPEIFDGAGASEQTDIYSLGVLLYYLATAAYPVTSPTVRGIQEAHRRGIRKSLADARPDLPPSLVAIINHALSPAATRFSNASAMEATLVGISGGALPSVVRTGFGMIPLAFTALLLLALALELWRAEAPGIDNELSIRRVFADAPVDGTTGLSSDGRYVSHPDWATTGDLLVTDLTTGRQRRLTQKMSGLASVEGAAFSAFSSDDRQIAFAWTASDTRSDLRVVNTDGSSPRLLYQDEATVHIPGIAWAPDDTKVAAVLSRDDGTHQLVLVPINGGTPRVLKTFGRRGPVNLRFSPDGKHLAYDLPERDDAPERDVFGMSIDGAIESPLVSHPAEDHVVGWGPGGGSLLFASTRSGGLALWSVPARDGHATGEPELLRPDLGNSWPIRLTASGSYYYGVPVTTNDIYTATLDPTLSIVVEPPKPSASRHSGTNKWPEWSPDGRQLAYVTDVRSANSGSRQLGLLIESVDTGFRRDITPQLSFVSRLRWAPDGRSLLANASDNEGQGGVFRIDLATSVASMLVPSLGLPRQTAWLRNGKEFLYWDIGARSDAPIMRRSLETGAERPLHGPGDFALSPDERWLVVNETTPAKSGTVLRLVPVAGGQGRDLVNGNFSLGCDWAPDSQQGLCVKVTGLDSRELWRFSIDDRPPQRVFVLNGMSEVRINPDGRRIAFSLAKGVTELWMMRNVVPRPPAPTP